MAKKTAKAAQKAPAEYTGVRAKLAQHRADNAGCREETLPRSGITVQIPDFFRVTTL